MPALDCILMMQRQVITLLASSMMDSSTCGEICVVINICTVTVVYDLMKSIDS